MDKLELGHRLRAIRQEKGYTQHALAEIADIGNVYIGEIERGLKMPSLHIFIKLIEALEVSADYILRDELTSGRQYVYDDLTQKLQDLTPKQRKTAVEILEAYLRSLE